MREFSESAAKLYDLFAEEFACWEKVPVLGSEYNDRGTIRHRYFFAIRHHALPAYDPSKPMSDNAVAQTRDHVPAALVDKYIRYCAMEDAMERFNG